MTKDEIVAGCLKGKRKAQEALYNLYGSRMFGVCLRYTQNRMEAEDVLQEGFVKVFKNIESFRNLGENSLGNWIKRIMVNTAINYLRDQKKHRYMIDADTVDVVSDESDDDFFTELNSLVSLDEILEIVQNLPQGYRMVFNLFAIEGYSHAEIADELQISVNTSKTQLFKARLNIVTEIRARAESRINVRQVI